VGGTQVFPLDDSVDAEIAHQALLVAGQVGGRQQQLLIAVGIDQLDDFPIDRMSGRLVGPGSKASQRSDPDC